MGFLVALDLTGVDIETSKASAGKVIIVDINGTGNYTSIQAAINNASSGDTIYVWNGTYTEGLVISKSITLIGNGSEETFIDCGYHVYYYGIYITNANWVNVSGFRIQNCSSGYDIYLNSANYCNISNNNFSKAYCNVYLYSSHFNSFYNNIIYDGYQYGIYVSGSNNNTFINNTCYYNGADIYYSINNTFINNIFLKSGLLIIGTILEHYNSHQIGPTNKIKNKPIYYFCNKIGIIVPSDAGQVILVNCTNSKVENLNISIDKNPIVLFYSNDNYITNNTYFVETSGIYLLYSNNNTIKNNSCSSLYSSDISLSNSNYNEIIDNNFSIGGSGIYLTISNNNSILNNDCSNNNWGILLYYYCNWNTIKKK